MQTTDSYAYSIDSLNLFVKVWKAHTRYGEWVHTPRDGRTHRSVVGLVVVHTQRRAHLDPKLDVYLPAFLLPAAQCIEN